MIKLFYWSSDALKNYAPGYIIAMGETVEEARENARAAWPAHARERWEYLAPEFQSEEDRADLEAKRQEFERDISAEPIHCPTDSILISGGE